MFLWSGEGRLYLYSSGMLGDVEAYGLIEEIDPTTLAPINRSSPLDGGGHVWCGAMVMHANGSIYVVHGHSVHKLDPNLRTLASRTLPADRPYNGVLIMADGRLLTKELRVDGTPSAFALLDADDLTVVETLSLAEASMGRIAAQRQPDGSDHIYVPGSEHVFRYRYHNGALTQDETWKPRYRFEGDGQGLAWDVCLGDGGVWFHDNGDIPAVRAIHSAHPAGTGALSFSSYQSAPVRLIRVAMADPDEVLIVQPSGLADGWVIAPPVYVPGLQIAVGFDTPNGVVSAWRWDGSAKLEPLWSRRIANWWQPMVYPETAELLLNDFVGADDNLVWLDLVTGREKGRAQTGSPAPNGMFPCPGQGRDVYYTSSPFIARAWVN